MATISLRSGSDPSGAAVGPVAADTLRGFMSNYYTGVTVVTAADACRAPHGLTCNSLVSVSLAPPTLLVCLNSASGTLAAVRATGGFAVHLMPERARPVAQVFASPDPDRFGALAWRRSQATGSPILVDDAFAVADCTVVEVMEVGDHAVVMGRVVAVECSPETPLLYGRREFVSPMAAAAGGGAR